MGGLLLGTLALAASGEKSCDHRTQVTRSAATEMTQKVQSGTWGGQHILLEVSENGAELTFDCAHGTIDQQMTVDSAGRFDLHGTFASEHAGPIRSGEEGNSRPAKYTGRVEGQKMTLTVTLPDSKDDLGTFSLKHGEQPNLTRCL